MWGHDNCERMLMDWKLTLIRTQPKRFRWTNDGVYVWARSSTSQVERHRSSERRVTHHADVYCDLTSQLLRYQIRMIWVESARHNHASEGCPRSKQSPTYFARHFICVDVCSDWAYRCMLVLKKKKQSEGVSVNFCSMDISLFVVQSYYAHIRKIFKLKHHFMNKKLIFYGVHRKCGLLICNTYIPCTCSTYSENAST